MKGQTGSLSHVYEILNTPMSSTDVILSTRIVSRFLRLWHTGLSREIDKMFIFLFFIWEHRLSSKNTILLPWALKQSSTVDGMLSWPLEENRSRCPASKWRTIMLIAQLCHSALSPCDRCNCQYQLQSSYILHLLLCKRQSSSQFPYLKRVDCRCLQFCDWCSSTAPSRESSALPWFLYWFLMLFG